MDRIVGALLFFVFLLIVFVFFNPFKGNEHDIDLQSSSESKSIKVFEFNIN